MSSLSSMITGMVERCVTAMGLVSSGELDRRLNEVTQQLEEKITMTSGLRDTELIERLAVRIGVVMAEVISLRESVVTKDAALAAAQAAFDAEVEGRNAEVLRQVTEALELDAQRDAARIEQLLRDAGGDLPTVPPVEPPPPGEPAEIPDGSGVDPVDEFTLPDTETGSGANQSM